MKNVIAWLALAGLAGAGCLEADKQPPKPTPVTTTAKKEPIKPVTADDITAANARQSAEQLKHELDQEAARSRALTPDAPQKPSADPVER